MGIKNIMKSEIANSDKCFIHDLKKIVDACRRQAYRTVNYAQVMMNWRIGQRIVEQEQGGSERAEYGKYVIKLASESLTEEYGRGFSESNIRSFTLSIKNLQFSRQCLLNLLQSSRHYLCYYLGATMNV